MGRLEPLARDLGHILKALSGMVFFFKIVSIIWEEYYAISALVLSGIIPLGTGYVLTTRYPRPEEAGKETQQGNEVGVIEQDLNRADHAASEYDALVINDDTTVKDTLRDSGAEDADALISTTDRDATNIMICMLATEMEIPTPERPRNRSPTGNTKTTPIQYRVGTGQNWIIRYWYGSGQETGSHRRGN